MKLLVRIYFTIILLAFTVQVCAQLKHDVCVKEILDLEKKMFSQDYHNSNETIFINYIVKATDWNGKMIESDVKIYRRKEKLHFFSEQAKMFRDNLNTVLVLKPQRAVVINGVAKNTSANYSDEFLELRMQFLTSCEVLKCSPTTTKNVKVVELRSRSKGGALKIDKMSYTYNVETGKLLSSITYYHQGFQVKKMEINYKELDFNSKYKFTKTAKKYVLGKGDKLLTTYNGYELIDNTNGNLR